MSEFSESEKIAQEYYDSNDAHQFYYAVWGGEDIHIGIYNDEKEAIKTASRRTVVKMQDLLPELNQNHKVIDFGGGYGGAARHLAQETGCHVTVLNISEGHNNMNRDLTQKANLQDKVDIVHGSFESVPFPDASFDVVWSEDAIVHSSRRDVVMAEAYRILKPSGHLIFTDIMQGNDCPADVLQPIYDRIHLESLSSFDFYQKTNAKLGFKERNILDLSTHMTLHYARVREELITRKAEIVQLASQEYVENMIAGLEKWVAAGDKGYLSWGILHFQK